MKTFINRTTTAAFILIAIVALGVAASAQQPAQMNALLAGLSANAKQLRRYTFKQRTEAYVSGELKNAKLDEVHYSTSGERISIPLNEQSAHNGPQRRGPGSRLIAKKIEEKRAEMKEYTERLMALTSRYLAPEPGKLQAALAGAEVTTGGGSNQVRITIRNFVKFGDRMTLSFDPATNQATKTEVHTTLDEEPVAVVLSYDQLREGPAYPGKTVVRSDTKQLEVRVLTYDYRL